MKALDLLEIKGYLARYCGSKTYITWCQIGGRFSLVMESASSCDETTESHTPWQLAGRFASEGIHVPCTMSASGARIGNRAQGAHEI